MEFEGFVTFKDCCEKVDIPSSTAREYRDMFVEFFTFTGKGRTRKYAPNTAKILKLISDLRGEGKSKEQVRYELNKRFGIPVAHYINKDNEDDLEETDISEVVAKQQQELGEYIASIAVREITAVFKNELAARDAVIEGLKNELAETRRDIAVTLEEVTAIRKEVAETRQDVREEVAATRQEVVTTRQCVGQDIEEMRRDIVGELKQTREASEIRDLEVVALAREALEVQKKAETRRGLFWFLRRP